jgi:hypothetical protein
VRARSAWISRACAKSPSSLRFGCISWAIDKPPAQCWSDSTPAHSQNSSPRTSGRHSGRKKSSEMATKTTSLKTSSRDMLANIRSKPSAPVAPMPSAYACSPRRSRSSGSHGRPPATPAA